MFLVYEENYLPDCDAADSFELFTTEDNARAEMERRKQKYLKQSHLSLPNDPGADANSISSLPLHPLLCVPYSTTQSKIFLEKSIIALDWQKVVLDRSLRLTMLGILWHLSIPPVPLRWTNPPYLWSMTLAVAQDVYLLHSTT